MDTTTLVHCKNCGLENSISLKDDRFECKYCQRKQMIKMADQIKHLKMLDQMKTERVLEIANDFQRYLNSEKFTANPMDNYVRTWEPLDILSLIKVEMGCE